MKQTLILDSSNLQYRAYYASEARPEYDKAGNPVAAVKLFRVMIQKLKRDYSPDLLIAGCDSRAPTFRTALYPDYKANRRTPPEDYTKQRPGFLEVLEQEGVASYSALGFEADDVIGTLAKKYSEQGDDVVIVSLDKDMAQLVSISHDNGCVSLLNTNKNVMLDPLGVLGEYGVMPHEVCDYLALVGDSSDNVPGARGIGPKGAKLLIKQFGNVEALCARAGEISSGLYRHNVIIYKEWILLSKKLVTIDCNAPVLPNFF